MEHNFAFLQSLGNGGTEGISMPLHHPRGPAQAGSKSPETIWREERGYRCVFGLGEFPRAGT